MDPWTWPTNLPIAIRQMVYREVSSRYQAPLHRHNLWQWYGVAHGRVIATVDGRDVRLGPHQSILVPPGIPRTYRTEKGAPGYVFALFTAVSGSGSSPVPATPVAAMTHPPALRPDFSELITLLSSPGSDTDLAALLCARIVLGLRAGSRPRADPTSEKNAGSLHTGLARRVDDLLSGALDQAWTRQGLARALHCSPSQLTRSYHAETDSTPFARLRFLRIELAKQLLRDSTLSISSITLETGFGSFSHFSQAFRKLVAMSPSEYRRLHAHRW